MKCKNDVAQFYRIYYPQYPDTLCDAIAEQIEQTLAKANEDPLYRAALLETIENKKKRIREEYWDLQEELEKSK